MWSYGVLIKIVSQRVKSVLNLVIKRIEQFMYAMRIPENN